MSLGYYSIIHIKNLETGKSSTIPIGNLENSEYSNVSNFHVLTPDGWQSFNGLRKTYSHENIRITFYSENYLICTPDHELFSSLYSKSKKSASNCLNETVFCMEHKIRVINIYKDFPQFTFDLINVHSGNRFFCGYDDVLVSNFN